MAGAVRSAVMSEAEPTAGPDPLAVGMLPFWPACGFVPLPLPFRAA